MSVRILSEEVINQIAAGEVVERPAHLVKELVENSLDAKAQHIQLSVSQGGRQISIQDDGMGMGEKDLSLCLERHGTSKIQTGEDLWKLYSFGFRGEALASIAAVTKLSIVSRPQDSEVALRLNCRFGEKQGPPQRCAGALGTSIYLEELFSNIPARLKFLKSPHAEIAQIKKVMKAMALSHPQVEFKVRQGEEMLLFYPKRKTSLERARQVLEQENLYESLLEKKGFEAHVLFASPNESLKSRRQMWLFVQDRWIQDAGLQSAIMGAHTGFMMKGMYPQGVLFLTCPPEDVDVNVHPNKSTLRFRDSQLAFKTVYACFRQGLERTPWVSQVLGMGALDAKKNPSQGGYLSATAIATSSSQNQSRSSFSGPGKTGAVLPASYTEKLQGMENSKVHFKVKEVVLPYERLDTNPEPQPSDGPQSWQKEKQQLKEQQGQQQKRGERKEPEKVFSPSSTTLTTPATPTNLTNPAILTNPTTSTTPATPATPTTSVSPKETPSPSWGQLQILGQAALTYIMTQSHEALIFIDQHAAHERVLFESLLLAHRGEKITTQQLLLPHPLSFSKALIEVLRQQQKDLEMLGIYLENTGPYQMSVVALPTFIKEKGLVEELKRLSEDMLSLGGSSGIHQLIHDFCASMACHSAIRAGKALSVKEMQSLLNEMDRFPLSSFCPHGRPVFVKYPFRKLEREFGRSV